MIGKDSSMKEPVIQKLRIIEKRKQRNSIVTSDIPHTEFSSLLNGEDKFKYFFQYAALGIALTDMDGRFLTINPYFCEMTGYRENELLSRNILEFIHPGDLENCIEQHRTMGRRVNPALWSEKRYIHKKGHIIHTMISNSVVQDNTGNPVSIIYHIQNSSDLKKAKELERRYDFIVNTSKNFMTLINRDYQYEAANKAYCNAYNKDPSELIDKTVAEVWGQKMFQEVIRGYLDRCFSGEEVNYQAWFEFLTLGNRYFDVTYYPYLNKDRHITHAVVISNDITENKLTEDSLQESYAKLRKTLEVTIDSLASALEMRDPYTAGHQQRVAELASAIAHKMNLPEDQVNGIRLASLVHDVGKIRIPAEILSKPGRLSDIEFTLIKTHPQTGYEILKSIEFPWPIAEIVLQHHEKLNGSGYPAGLKGNEILTEAKIIAVADVVEAMSSHRPYRPTLGLEKALAEISSNGGSLYDSKVTEACLSLFQEDLFSFKK